MSLSMGFSGQNQNEGKNSTNVKLDYDNKELLEDEEEYEYEDEEEYEYEDEEEEDEDEYEYEYEDEEEPEEITADKTSAAADLPSNTTAHNTNSESITEVSSSSENTAASNCNQLPSFEKQTELPSFSNCTESLQPKSEEEEETSSKKSPTRDMSPLTDKFDSIENDSDFGEILISAVDMAAGILREGREIQKISVIRTLPDLLDGHGQECVEKILPLVQGVFETESCNLDIHCEGAVAFRNILADRGLCARLPVINGKILDGILLNLQQQKDNLSATAWLETLIDVVDHIALEDVRLRIVPIALSQADASQRVQRRVIATKLLEKLCTLLDYSTDVKSDLIPCVQMLCQDPNANVRSSIGQRLPVVAKSLHSATESVALILPRLIELCRDEDCSVRETIFNTVAACLPYFDKESLRQIVIPLLKKCSEQTLRLNDVTVTAVAKNLGLWCYNLRDVLSKQDRVWFLSLFERLSGSADTSGVIGPASNLMTQSDPQGLSLLEQPTFEDPSQVACRRMCAYNFPCMVMLFGAEAFETTLLPILERLCVDGDEHVRACLAAGYHEIVTLLPHEASLINPFIELIRGGESEIVCQLTKRLDIILPCLYTCASTLDTVDSNGNTQLVNQKTQLDRILIACNRLVRGTGAWRSHEAFLRNIAYIRQTASADDLHITFVPLLKEEILTARALPCRLAAVETLLLFMRDTESDTYRQNIIDFFIETLSLHQSYHKRRVYLDAMLIVLRLFSRKFFKEHFLNATVKLSDDKLANIRLKVCKLLSNVKQNLVIPGDEHLLAKIERTSRLLVSNESSVNVRLMLRQYATELDRTSTAQINDPIDKEKEKEEKLKWTSGRPKALLGLKSGPQSGVSNKPPAMSRPASTAATTASSSSRLRLQRPKTAIVRPQPQIVITKRSPSPMPNTPAAAKNKENNKPEENGQTVVSAMDKFEIAANSNSGGLKLAHSSGPSRTAKIVSTTTSNSVACHNNPIYGGKNVEILSSRLRPSTNTTNSSEGQKKSSTSGTVSKSSPHLHQQMTVNSARTSSAFLPSNSAKNTLPLHRAAAKSAIPVSGWRRQQTPIAHNGPPTRSSSEIDTSNNTSNGTSNNTSNNTSTASSNRSSSTLVQRTSAFGLVKVQSSSAIERKPSQISFRVYAGSKS